ncbi:MAG: D-2-hydroxyacid dehydrogenase family protein [Burkholderiaceae bacterium]|nr:D-2-hydroxyacid dehydrogenase family protein [Burkholderiaceae bacterium]
MKIAILDDYQDAVRTLACFRLLQGHEVRVWTDHTEDTDTLAARLAETEVLVMLRGRTPIRAALLERLPRLRFISQSGHTDHIDLTACERLGIVVSAISATRPSYATAELTWGLILAAQRHLVFEVGALKAGRWQSTLGQGLRGHTLGIYGYGRIGALVAGYGRAFGMKVQVWGRESTLAKAREAGHATAGSRAEFFATSDVLSLHVRYSPATRHLVTGEDLARMKPDALFVNTSRAELIEPGALAQALAHGRPGRAAVDVYDVEPVPADEPLLALDNALCTPHLGYIERDSHEFAFGNAFEQVQAYARGEPINVCTPAAARRPAAAA